MDDFELMADPRFPMIREALATLKELLLILPRIAHAVELVAEAIRGLVPLSWAWLCFRVLQWLMPRSNED